MLKNIPINTTISTMTDTVIDPFIILKLQDGSVHKFKLEKHVGKRRKRIKCVLNYIKENPHNITPNTIRSLKLYAKLPVHSCGGRLGAYPVYMTLPGVQERVDEFLNGISGGAWPQLYTIALLWALIKSGVGVNKSRDFWYHVSPGSRYPVYKHVLDLRYVVSNVPDQSHDLQRKFMTIMCGIPPFGSSGLDQAMIAHICTFMSSPEYIDRLNAHVEKKAAKKTFKAAI